MKKPLLKLALGIIALSTGLNSFAQTYTFTNAGATGRTGPTQGQVNTEYSGTTLDGDVTINTQGIQEWTVPTTGDYQIEVLGAEGGDETDSPDTEAGKGAKIIGEFNLTAGTVLKILVGQKGGDANVACTSGNRAAGGGGGSFVTDASNTAYIVAGGGNGDSWGNWNTDAPSGKIINTGTGGGSSFGRAGGGGGLSGNGINHGSSATGGLSFINGGTGGLRVTCYGGEGGFGGGGGAQFEGGGAGGYTGGSSVNQNQYNTSYPTYGAGSYNNGTNKADTANFNSGMGLITITTLCPVPTITCPSNITVDNDAGICGAEIIYTDPVTTGCDVLLTQLSGIASGEEFPVGVTSNEFEVNNDDGTATCSFTVTVIDTTAPSISCPANFTSCDEVVNYDLPVASDNCSGATVALISGPASGDTFPLGTTTVTYMATDLALNNSPTCSFDVTVVALTSAPTITCLGNTSSCDTIVSGIAPVSASNCTGQVITYTLTGATTGSGTTDASGSDFNVGVTNVKYYVTDGTGLTDSCDFDVTVHPQTSVSLNSFSTDTICHGNSPITLPTGTPAGGTYSGPGVVGTTFDPSTAGQGTHTITYTVTDGNSCAVTDQATIVVEFCVSIGKNTSLDKVNIYPNPTNGLVHINLENNNDAINYTISTIEGRIVKQASNVTTNKMIVNLSNESKGIYLLRIEGQTSSNVYKIIRK